MRIAPDQSAIGFHRGANISALLGCLCLCIELVCSATDLLVAWGNVLGLFAGFKDHRGRDRARGGAPNQGRQKQNPKGRFHRVAQGSYLRGSVKGWEARNGPRRRRSFGAALVRTRGFIPPSRGWALGRK